MIVLSTLGGSLSAKISDLMRIAWESRGASDPVPNNAIHRSISALRSNQTYKAVVWAFRRHILPFCFFLFVLWFTATFGSHLAFNIADAAGAFCRGDDALAKPVNLGIDQVSPITFATTDFCAPTALKMKAGYRYEITVVTKDPWRDDAWPTTPAGFHTAELPRLNRAIYYLGVPLRRAIFRPWFRLIARVGEKGTDEYFLDPVQQMAKRTDSSTGQVTRTPTNTYKAQFRADRDGEVFLYVNDAAIGLPWLYSWFYRSNNHGTADVSIKVL